MSIHGHKYRGINTFILGFTDYADPRWITFAQAKKMGGNVRKGEKSMPIVFWSMVVKKQKESDGSESITRFPIAKLFRVFNVEQCDGLDLKPMPELVRNDLNPIERCENVVAGMPNAPEITHNGSRAFYRPSTDTVSIPVLGQFESAEEYYGTLFHELAHSTGHADRLNRKGVGETPFGSPTYTREELVAEMTSAFLAFETGIDNDTIEQSAAYIDGWRRAILDDKKAIVMAAQQAQKAADYILDRLKKEEPVEAEAVAA